MPSRSDQYNDYLNCADEYLVQQYKDSGNKEFVGILFKRYSHLVFGVCMHYFCDKDKAADAVMGIFEKLFDSLVKYDIGNFKAWLCTVSRNHCLMQLRISSAKRLVFVDDLNHLDGLDMENEFPMHLNNADLNDKIETLLDSISTLKPRQQECIRLFYLESCSYAEVARQAGLSVQEVKSHIQNGKRNLKLIMEAKKQ